MKWQKEEKEKHITLSELERLYLDFSSKNLDKDTIQTKKSSVARRFFCFCRFTFQSAY